jgi:nitroimidazol reductase NimA-like FMN-containing flavoprotein (pyridoxamine 5'-phosphate oxidase superfamily)
MLTDNRFNCRLLGLVKERVALKFSTAEKHFIYDNEVARFATVGPDEMPHVVPVCYVYSSDAFGWQLITGQENIATSRGMIESRC